MAALGALLALFLLIGLIAALIAALIERPLIARVYRREVSGALWPRCEAV